MSQASSSSHRRCRCGGPLKILTAKTYDNVGRRFWRCQCGYFEWEDEVFPERALVVIRDLNASLDALKIERNNLKHKVDVFEPTNNMAVAALKDEIDKLKEKVGILETQNNSLVENAIILQEKLLKMKMVMLMSLALFVGFVAAMLVK